MKFAVVAILRDEFDYLFEWIAWYLEAGFEQFYLADNGSRDGTLQFIEALEQAGIAKIWHEPCRKRAQIFAYNAILEKWGTEVDAIAFIDADEFIVSNDALPVADHLKKLMSNEKVGAVAINWRIFGSNGHLKQEPGLVIERFQTGAVEEHALNQFIKTVVKPMAVKQIYVHEAELFPTFYYVDCVGKPMQFVNENRQPVNVPQGLSMQVRISPLRINHYVIKSLQEFTEKKRRRGDAIHGSDYDRGHHFFLHHDINEIYYGTASDYAQQIKKRMRMLEDKLKQDSHFFLRLKGNIGACTCSIIRGWVYAPERPALRLSVNVFVNGIYKATIPAFYNRPHIKKQDLNADGFCGFIHSFEPTLNNGDVVEVSVFANRYKFPKNRFVIAGK